MKRLAPVIALLTLGAPAKADLLINGGFETPVLSSGSFITYTPGQVVGSGWTAVGAAVTLLQTAYGEPANGIPQFNAQEGLNSLDLTGPFNTGPSAGVQQTVATVAGEQYTLSFYVGRATPASGPGNFYPTPATVDLSIDGGPRQSFTNSQITLGALNWRQFTTTFTAAGSSTTITFLNGTPAGNNEAGLDNVVLVRTAVPEPASLALTGLGALGLIGFGRRRARAKATA